MSTNLNKDCVGLNQLVENIFQKHMVGKGKVWWEGGWQWKLIRDYHVEYFEVVHGDFGL